MSSNEHNDPLEVGTPITALRQFIGSRPQHDLNFEIGDIMKITSLIDNEWAMAKLKDKTGFIPLTHIKPIKWFHGKITREQAEFLLTDKLEGSFLVRESTHFPGDYTLCLKSESKVENYHIKRINSVFTIDDDRSFPTLIKLINCYTKVPELACLLKMPIKMQKIVENDDLQSLINHTKCHSSIIEKSLISFGKEIGTGEFGAVYKGKYRDTDIAIKVIKDQTTIKEFFKEAAVMSTLNHPNLLKLFGIVFSDNRQEIYLVTEYMPKGSLLDYLITRGRNVLTKRELIQFSVHICEGMSYLEEKGIVHRDLAASNVLISEDNVAKVSDFGLAKQIMVDETKNGVRIRIKWTAPEAIKEKHYSNKSDSWSFGILLWEVFSFGRVPYPRIPVNDVLQYVEQGNRMEKPEGCPDDVYNLMKHTWHLDPTLRPSFKEILINLKNIQLNLHD